MANITIKQAEIKDVLSTQDFLMHYLEKFFGEEGKKLFAQDIFGLERKYIKPERANMWLALNQDERIVGTIAVCQYNDRMAVVKGRYKLETTAEIGRCYVDEKLRGQGIGTKLLETATTFCQEQGYQTLYLHTHHFLPGGFSFWQKQGFIATVDEGGSMQIIHMQKKWEMTSVLDSEHFCGR